MVTSFGVFKYMALYSIVQFVSILILYSVLTTTHACLLASYSAIFIVTTRIQFKIALLTFKTLTTHQPSYIHDLLQPHCSSRQLGSASHNLLETLQMRTGFAQRSFAYSAPHIWNSLPHIITGNLDVTANTFKKKLKKFYYTNYYA